MNAVYVHKGESKTMYIGQRRCFRNLFQSSFLCPLTASVKNQRLTQNEFGVNTPLGSAFLLAALRRSYFSLVSK